MMELILTNKESTSEIIQFSIVLATVAMFSMALTGFSVKKIIQFALSK